MEGEEEIIKMREIFIQRYCENPKAIKPQQQYGCLCKSKSQETPLTHFSNLEDWKAELTKVSTTSLNWELSISRATWVSKERVSGFLKAIQSLGLVCCNKSKKTTLLTTINTFCSFESHCLWSFEKSGAFFALLTFSTWFSLS